MAERWVLNASPLIVLTNSGYGDLIRQLADEVLVPRAVADEILAGPADDRARLEIAGGDWLVDDTPGAPADRSGSQGVGGGRLALRSAMQQGGTATGLTFTLSMPSASTWPTWSTKG
jgi:hypothetical protein